LDYPGSEIQNPKSASLCGSIPVSDPPLLGELCLVAILANTPAFEYDIIYVSLYNFTRLIMYMQEDSTHL